MIGILDSIVYISCLSMGILYALYCYFKNGNKPNLGGFCIIVTTSYAFYSAMELVLNVLLNKELSLGQLKGSTLTIILGGCAVVWISVTCIVDTIKKSP